MISKAPLCLTGTAALDSKSKTTFFLYQQNQICCTLINGTAASIYPEVLTVPLPPVAPVFTWCKLTGVFQNASRNTLE